MVSLNDVEVGYRRDAARRALRMPRRTRARSATIFARSREPSTRKPPAIDRKRHERDAAVTTARARADRELPTRVASDRSGACMRRGRRQRHGGARLRVQRRPPLRRDPELARRGVRRGSQRSEPHADVHGLFPDGARQVPHSDERDGAHPRTGGHPGASRGAPRRKARVAGVRSFAKVMRIGA